MAELAERGALQQALEVETAMAPGAPSPRISVVIPAYNRADTLGGVLRAYAAQTLSRDEFEVIVVDDESRDEIAHIVADCRSLPITLRYFWHVPNGGPGAARNVGVRAARALIVLFACDDTFPTPTLLIEHLAVHAADPAETVAVLGGIEWDPACGVNRLMRYTTEESGLQYNFRAITNPRDTGWEHFYASNLSLKHAFLLTQDPVFDPVFLYGYEDLDLGYRLGQLGLRIIYHPAALTYHHHHYTLETFCRRMHRVGLMAPIAVARHPELQDRICSWPFTSLHAPKALDDLMEEIQTAGAAIAELEKPDSVLLNRLTWRGQEVGTMLDRLRGDLYREVFNKCFARGIYDGARSAGLPVIARLPITYSIVIVTYNSAAEIGACLASIARSSFNDKHEIIVVDNASSDDTVSQVLAFAEGRLNVHLIVNGENRGYARAANHGITQACGEYVTMLNPDTGVGSDWLPHLSAHVSDRVGGVGPISDAAAGNHQLMRHFRGPLPRQTTVEELSKTVYAQNKGRSVPTKLLVGFCTMVPRRVFEQVGRFDESLFLGNDDLDFSWRLQLAGLEMRIATDVFVHHKNQASFKSLQPSRSQQLTQDSTDRLAQKLESYYGRGKVPSPLELWDIDWFRPRSATDRPQPNQLVSIVILAHNQLDFTRQCIESLQRFTPEPHELILIDNGSTDGTADYFRSVPGARVVINPTNIGFGRGCNQGLTIARGGFVLLLNNDTVVTQGWLWRMLQTLQQNPLVGMVGPCTNYAVPPQVVRDVPYRNLDQMQQYALEFVRSHVGQMTVVPRLIGFCLLIRRDVIERIGGFDERYGNGNFEDDDFCVRAAIAGFTAVLRQDVFIHHFGSQTFVGAGIDYAVSMTGNWEIFRSKWGLSATLDPQRDGYPFGEIVKRPFDLARDYVPLPSAVATIDVPDDLLPRSSGQPTASPADRTGSAEDSNARALALVEEGRRHLNQGQLDEAVQHFEQALAIQSSMAGAHYLLGFALFQQDKAEAARERFRRAVAMDPNNADFRNALGAACEALNLFADAESSYRQALHHDPANAAALRNLADLLAARERPAEATSFYERLLFLTPDDAAVRGLFALAREKAASVEHG